MERSWLLTLLSVVLLAFDLSGGPSKAQADDSSGGSSDSGAATVDPAVLKQQQDDRKLIFDSIQRSPELGAVLSFGAGFGAGEFYCANDDVGYISAGAQLVAAGAGVAAGSSVGTFVALSLVARVVDAFIAEQACESFNDTVQQQFKLGAPQSQQSQALNHFQPAVALSSSQYSAGLSFHF